MNNLTMEYKLKNIYLFIFLNMLNFYINIFVLTNKNKEFDVSIELMNKKNR